MLSVRPSQSVIGPGHRASSSWRGRATASSRIPVEAHTGPAVQGSTLHAHSLRFHGIPQLVVVVAPSAHICTCQEKVSLVVPQEDCACPDRLDCSRFVIGLLR